jgi:taurine transport system permease protein
MADTAITTDLPRAPEPRPRRKLPSHVLPSVLTVGAILALWTAASTLGWTSPVFLPSPARVWRALVTVATDGYASATLLEHAGASLARVLQALIATLVVGIPIGLAIATSRIGRGIFDPIVEFIRPLPPLAYLPLVIIWFGIGELSKVLVISLAMLAPIVLSTVAGARAASENQIRAARAFGASRADVVRHVMLPAALPSIFTGVRIALGAGWTTLVAAELIAATEGLGYMIQSAAQFLVTDMVIAGILVISALAILTEVGLRAAEKRLIPWVGRS